MKKNIKFVFIGVLISLSFFLSQFAMAATVSLSTLETDIVVGDTFETGLFVNTESVDVNAIEGKIIFPKDVLLLKEIRDGNSIINFWVDRPETAQGEVYFSGIIPGGYMSNKGLVFSLVFQSLDGGEAAIKITNLKILANDGQGSVVLSGAKNLNILIANEKMKTSTSTSLEITVPKIFDTVLPEIFTPEVISDVNLAPGKFFLIFATQDKGSGIDHYEVCEGINRECVSSESPYLLVNQKLNTPITVKAFDKANNVRIAMLPSSNSYLLFPYLVIFGIILLLLIFGFLVKKICIKFAK